MESTDTVQPMSSAAPAAAGTAVKILSPSAVDGPPPSPDRIGRHQRLHPGPALVHDWAPRITGLIPVCVATAVRPV